MPTPPLPYAALLAPARRWAVTGGAGFIGSHVAELFLGAGWEVAVLDDLSSGKRENVPAGARFYPCDVRSAAAAEAVLRERPQVVCHHAAQIDVRKSMADPRSDADVNLGGLLALMEAAVRAGSVEQVLFASSGGAIYGDQAASVFREDDLTVPVSPYAIGKQAIEGYLRYFRRKRGLASTVFRISNPYGPRQNPAKRQGVIPIFLRRLAEGLPLVVYGDGSMVRDYMYVADMAEMVADAVTRGTSQDLYNLGSGVGTSLRELVRCIAQATGVEPEVHHAPTPSTFVDHVTLDTSRFTAELGPREMTPLTEGIRRTWDEIREVG